MVQAEFERRRFSMPPAQPVTAAAKHASDLQAHDKGLLSKGKVADPERFERPTLRFVV